MARLSETVEAFICGGGLREFVKFWRVGSIAYIAQRCSHWHGRFLGLIEYSSGGQHGFVVPPEGGEGQGWKICVLELPTVVAFLEEFFGVG